MSDHRHFDIGIQPQDRADYHAQILADPAWKDTGDGELATILGESIVAALGSMTTRLMIDPTAQIAGYDVAFSSEQRNETPNAVIITSGMLEITGLDPARISQWQDRVEDATEDQPMAFDLTMPQTASQGESAGRIRVGFDGTNYYVSRLGRQFDVQSPGGKTVSGNAWDSWQAWDYNAEKRRQHIAKRDGISQEVQSLILSLDSSSNAELVARILCTMGIIQNESFLSGPRGRLSDEGYDYDQVTYLQILANHSLGLRYDGATKDNFDLLHTVSLDLQDATQRALVQYWFVTEGQREMYRNSGEPTEEVRARLTLLLQQKVTETQGAANWDSSQTRKYLLSVLDHETDLYTQAFTREYAGHAFQFARGAAGVRSEVEHPEITGDEQTTDMALAMAVADNPPDYALTEMLRQIERVTEDYEQTEDAEAADSLDAQRRALMNELQDRYGDYYARLEDDAEAAQAQLGELGLPEVQPDSRALVIEGILLARELARLADEIPQN